ncbi:MAG: alpha-galactosidase [Acutalibacteraceae bacterium]|nr:alpha-galactosidase [Acutalibacteraceae bacterium]
MPISFDKERKIFKIDSLDSTYAVGIFEGDFLVQLYYGKKIPDTNLISTSFRGGFASISPLTASTSDNGYFSLDIQPMAYSCNGSGDFRLSALSIRDSEGRATTDIRYVDHKIYSGKPKLKGLPATYCNSDDEADTLEIIALDKFTGAKVTLCYTAFKNHSIITQSVKIENTGKEAFDIEKIASCCVNFPSMSYNMVNLYGTWARERTATTHHLVHGIQSVASKRGSSSHNHNPFVALVDDKGGEDYGDAFGFNLVYSGNFAIDIETDYLECTRLVMGINPIDFNWYLEPGEEFQSPEAVMAYSPNGLGGMSRTFHDFYNNNLIRGTWKNKKRPLLINSWEGSRFDFDDETLVRYAKQAKELGCELLVMDDGWFGVRNCDDSSLGDWYVNEDKLNGPLSKLIERVNAEGMEFGIWYEPEMISPDSDIYRAHPDWCVHVEGRDISPARQQYVIDMTRQDVRDNIFNQMYDVLSKNNIAYLKWDYNRPISEPASMALDKKHQKEFFHRFILGTYELMDRITSAFPDILFESCSGGGGRYDPGMLYYMPQTWASDNTDPIERLRIQFGTSMCYPASSMGAHVSASDRAGLETKAAVALWGTFGYELDPKHLSDDDKEVVKKTSALYHKYYDLTHNGDLYRIIAPTEDEFKCAWSFVAKDKSEALLTVIIKNRTPHTFLNIRLKGLDENKMYVNEANGEIYSGALLMNAGVNLSVGGDFDGGTNFMVHFKEA